jgi:oxaloacetate decarboxylase beta subunit
VAGYVERIVHASGFVTLTMPHVIMIALGLFLLWLAISRGYQPLLLAPLGFGVLVGNMPLPQAVFNSVSVYMIDPVSREYVFNTGNSLLGVLYSGVRTGVLPPLVFLGLGAMTDFGGLLSNPKSLLLAAAAQFGIFIPFLGALALGFSPQSAASVGIIGGADGPAAIFTASRLAPALVGPIALSAFLCAALAPIIQRPVMRLLTSREERLIRMKPGRPVSRLERTAFPIMGMIVTGLVAPAGLPLLGALFFGNLLKESGVTGRLAKTAANAMLDTCTILLGLAVGASISAHAFLNTRTAMVVALGCAAFVAATAGGVLAAKVINMFSADKLNPLIGAAGVAAPDAARAAHVAGQAEDPANHLLPHAMGPNAAGVIATALAAGVFLGMF